MLLPEKSVFLASVSWSFFFKYHQRFSKPTIEVICVTNELKTVTSEWRGSCFDHVQIFSLHQLFALEPNLEIFKVDHIRKKNREPLLCSTLCWRQLFPIGMPVQSGAWVVWMKWWKDGSCCSASWVFFCCCCCFVLYADADETCRRLTIPSARQTMPDEADERRLHPAALTVCRLPREFCLYFFFARISNNVIN